MTDDPNSTFYCHFISCALARGDVRHGAAETSVSGRVQRAWACQSGRADLDPLSRTVFLVLHAQVTSDRYFNRSSIHHTGVPRVFSLPTITYEHRMRTYDVPFIQTVKTVRISTDILWRVFILQCGYGLHYSVDLRIQTYTERLKYGKLATYKISVGIRIFFTV